MKELNDQNFTQALSSTAGVALVDFSATWCGHCEVEEEILKNIIPNYKSKVHFFKADIDQAPKAAGQFQVMSLPTIIVLKKGQEINRVMGGVDKGKITSILDEALS